MSEFKKWMTAMGYHGKQVSKAGDAVGLGQTSARERYRGEKRPDLTERLAVAAVTGNTAQTIMDACSQLGGSDGGRRRNDLSPAGRSLRPTPLGDRIASIDNQELAGDV